jgi:hypothetical protein
MAPPHGGLGIIALLGFLAWHAFPSTRAVRLDSALVDEAQDPWDGG